jgi:iron-sulfur cluster repair protein YtfE (RIC family)
MTQPHACTCAESGGGETITSFLSADHRHADALLGDAVQHAAKANWPQCARQLAAFRGALETHMKLEEQVLFPAFERATGSDAGPTAVMRHEHRQMIQMLDEMTHAAASQAGERFDVLAPAFTRIIDTHSMKEENMLYPMCDRVLDATTSETLRETLNELRRVERT